MRQQGNLPLSRVVGSEMVCFLCGRSGHGVRLVGRAPGWPILCNLASENAGMTSVGKRRLIRGGGGSYGPCSNASRFTNPGGSSLAASNRTSVPVWALSSADPRQHRGLQMNIPIRCWVVHRLNHHSAWQLNTRGAPKLIGNLPGVLSI